MSKDTDNEPTEAIDEVEAALERETANRKEAEKAEKAERQAAEKADKA
jgi:hypothetical protein